MTGLPGDRRAALPRARLSLNLDTVSPDMVFIARQDSRTGKPS